MFATTTPVTNDRISKPKCYVFPEGESIRLLKNRALVARLWKEYHAGDPWYASWTDADWRGYAGSRAAEVPPNAEAYLHVFEATPIDDRREIFPDPGAAAARPRSFT